MIFMEMTEMMVVGKTSRRVFYDVSWGSAQLKSNESSSGELMPATDDCFWRCLALANNRKSRKQHLVF
jgi:hypothetical protein